MPSAPRPVFDVLRSLPRMSWRPLNLYILWRRSLGPVAAETVFTRSSMTLFQQRWRSKRLVRGYHGDHIPEKIFKRWFLPRSLPDVRSHKTAQGKADERAYLQAKFSDRPDEANEVIRRRKAASAQAAQTPLGSLMFMELERRLDTFIFRCCFAPSVYQARQLVIHKNVRVNGELQPNANYRLSPGDMVSVDPGAMIILKPRTTTPPPHFPVPVPEGTASEKNSISGATTASEASPPSESDASSPQKPSVSSKSNADEFSFPPYASPHLFLPAYIESSPATCSAIYVRHPTARPGYSEVPSPYDAGGEVMRFAWEWYKKNRMRERKGGIMSRWKNPQFTRK